MPTQPTTPNSGLIDVDASVTMRPLNGGLAQLKEPTIVLNGVGRAFLRDLGRDLAAPENTKNQGFWKGR